MEESRPVDAYAPWLLGDVTSGPAYDVVLVAHILAVVAALVAVAVAGVSALALLRPGPVPDGVRRYYRPGINWAGRTLFLVPVLGVVLVAQSKGRWTFSDGWIVIGLVLWVVAASLAEMVLWPSERRVQDALRTIGPRSEPTGAGAASAEPSGPTEKGTELRRLGGRAVAAAAVVIVVLLAASVVMVAKP